MSSSSDSEANVQIMTSNGAHPSFDIIESVSLFCDLCLNPPRLILSMPRLHVLLHRSGAKLGYLESLNKTFRHEIINVISHLLLKYFDYK